MSSTPNDQLWDRFGEMAPRKAAAKTQPAAAPKACDNLGVQGDTPTKATKSTVKKTWRVRIVLPIVWNDP